MKYILFILGVCWINIGIGKLLPSDYKLLTETENNSQFDLAWHARLAGYGDPESQFFMAKVYEDGKLVPPNRVKAIEFYKKAANQGHIESMMKLADLEPSEKIKWLEAAGNKNYIQAQLKLSQVYEKANQKEKAIEWLEKAMHQMFPNVDDLTTVSPKLKELKDSP